MRAVPSILRLPASYSIENGLPVSVTRPLRSSRRAATAWSGLDPHRAALSTSGYSATTCRLSTLVGHSHAPRSRCSRHRRLCRRFRGRRGERRRRRLQRAERFDVGMVRWRLVPATRSRRRQRGAHLAAVSRGASGVGGSVRWNANAGGRRRVPARVHREFAAWRPTHRQLRRHHHTVGG